VTKTSHAGPIREYENDQTSQNESRPPVPLLTLLTERV